MSKVTINKIVTLYVTLDLTQEEVQGLRDLLQMGIGYHTLEVLNLKSLSDQLAEHPDLSSGRSNFSSIAVMYDVD